MIPLDKDAYQIHFYGKPYAYHTGNYSQINLNFSDQQYKDLNNGSIIAICPLTKENQSTYIVFDFDGPNDGGRVALKPVKDFKDFLLNKGIKPVIFFSGSKGFHVYIFFDHLLHSHPLKIYAERLKKDFLKSFTVDNVEIEIFPKQTNIDWNIKKYGNHLKAPFSKHPNGDRSTQLTDYIVNQSSLVTEFEKTLFKEVDVAVIANAIFPYFSEGVRHRITLGVSGYLKFHGIEKSVTLAIFEELTGNCNADKNDIFRVIEDTYSKSNKDIADLSYALLPSEVEELIFSFVSGVDKKNIKFKILQIRDTKNKPHIKIDLCVKFLTDYITSSYRLFYDTGFVYIVYGDTLYTDQNYSLDSLLLSFGLNKEENFARVVRYAVIDYIRTKGIFIEPIMYSRFTEDHIQVFTKSAIKKYTADNIEDTIDFLPVLRYKEYIHKDPTFKLINYLKEFGLDEHDREIILSWLVAQLFSETMKTRPILLLQGPPGCGKTTLATFLLRLIESIDRNPIAFSGKDDSLTASMAIHKVLVLDNLEFIKQSMIDVLNSVTTGTKIELRKLYTTNEVVEVVPRCSIIITSAFASLDQDGALQSRLIRIKMNGREDFGEESTYWNRFKNDYDDLFSELLFYARIVLKAEKVEYKYILRFTDYIRVSKVLKDYDVLRYDIEKILFVRQSQIKRENIYYKIYIKLVPYEKIRDPFIVDAIFPRFSAIAKTYGINNLTVSSLSMQLLKTGMFQKLSNRMIQLTPDFVEVEKMISELDRIHY